MALNHSIVAVACLKACSTDAKPKRRGNLNDPSSKTFYDYAQVYWPIHCQYAQHYRRKEPLETAFRAFLCGGKLRTKEFAEWSTRWKQSWTHMELEYRLGTEEGDLWNQLRETEDTFFETKPTCVACAFGFPEVIEDRRQAGMAQRDSKVRNYRGRDLYGIAVRYGHKDIVNLLRATTKLDSPTAKESALLAAVSLGELDMVTMLLEENPDLVITTEIVKAAAGYSDVNMVRFLSEEYYEFTVTEELLLEAAWNESHGGEVISFLFEQAPEDIDELDKPRLLRTACSNYRSGYGILQCIVDNIRPFSITEEVVQAAASNDTDAYQMLKCLFRLDRTIKISEEIVEAAAGNAKAEPIRLLMSYAPDLTVTWQIVTAAVQNKDCGDEVLLLLLDKSKEPINIDEDILLAAVTNRKLAVTILDILLPRCDRTCVTSEVLQAAAQHQFLGERLIIRLLKHVPDMSLAPADLEAAASNVYYAPEVLRELLNFDKRVSVTVKALQRAALNYECGPDALELLLPRKAAQDAANISVVHTYASPPSQTLDSLDISTLVVEYAAANTDSGVDVMKLLLRFDSNLTITPKAIENAAANSGHGDEILDLWQEHNKKLDVSVEAIREAARNQNLGPQTMKLLLRSDKTIPITDDAMEAAAANPYDGLVLVKLMLPRWKNNNGWEQVFSGASRNGPMGVSIMKYLISRRAPPISSDTIESCALSSLVDVDPIVTLLNACSNVTLGREIVESASFYPQYFFDILSALRSHDPSVSITDGALERIFEGSFNVMETIEMLTNANPLKLTEGLLKAIVQNFTTNEYTILHLCEYAKAQSGISSRLPITEEVIAAGLQNSGTGAASLVKRLLELAPGPWDADVNEKRLQVAATAWRSDLMIPILLEHAKESGHVLAITTKTLIKAAANRTLAKPALKTLLPLIPSSQQDIALTPEVLMAAAKNASGDSSIKLLITYAKERQRDLQISELIFNAAAKVSRDTVRTILRFWQEQGKINIGSMITEKTLQEAASCIENWVENSAFHFLLKIAQAYGKTIHVTANMFEAARGSLYSDVSGWLVFYFRRICRIQGLEFSDLITPRSLINISSRDNLELFLDLLNCVSEFKRKELLTDEVALGVAGNGASDVLSHLLYLKPYPFQNPPSYYCRICDLQIADWGMFLGRQRALLKSGVYTNAVMSSTGRTMFSISAGFNEMTSLRAFLKHGKDVDIDHKDILGNTSLHYACENGNFAVVEMLLEAGANGNLKNDEGLTAVDTAAEKSHFMIARLIQGWGQEKVQSA